MNSTRSFGPDKFRPASLLAIHLKQQGISIQEVRLAENPSELDDEIQLTDDFHLQVYPFSYCVSLVESHHNSAGDVVSVTYGPEHTDFDRVHELVSEIQEKVS